jgi:SAM-dependent methyltransferase
MRITCHSEKSFDAAILAHVLQVFEDPREIFEETVRVVKKDIVALIRKRDDPNDKGDSFVRQIFERVSAEMGYEQVWHASERRRKEREFLAAVPPTEFATIQDELIETSVGERLSLLFEKHAFRPSLEVPDEVLQKIIREVKSSSDSERKIQYRIVEQMAIWRLEKS